MSEMLTVFGIIAVIGVAVYLFKKNKKAPVEGGTGGGEDGSQRIRK